jgi:hypothetical protein
VAGVSLPGCDPRERITAAGLREPGLDTTRPILVVIDGAKTLAAAVRVNGHLHLPALHTALDTTITAVTPAKEDAAWSALGRHQRSTANRTSS